MTLNVLQLSFLFLKIYLLLYDSHFSLLVYSDINQKHRHCYYKERGGRADFSIDKACQRRKDKMGAPNCRCLSANEFTSPPDKEKVWNDHTKSQISQNFHYAYRYAAIPGFKEYIVNSPNNEEYDAEATYKFSCIWYFNHLFLSKKAYEIKMELKDCKDSKADCSKTSKRS